MNLFWLIRFDGCTNWKLTPSVDGSQLIASSDTFTRIHSMNYTNTLSQPAATVINNIPPLVGASFQENSGKVCTWFCS